MIISGLDSPKATAPPSLNNTSKILKSNIISDLSETTQRNTGRNDLERVKSNKDQRKLLVKDFILIVWWGWEWCTDVVWAISDSAQSLLLALYHSGNAWYPGLNPGQTHARKSFNTYTISQIPPHSKAQVVQIQFTASY